MPDLAFIYSVLAFASILCLLGIVVFIFIYIVIIKKSGNKHSIFPGKTNIPLKPISQHTPSSPVLTSIQKKKTQVNYSLIGKEIVARDPSAAANVIKKWLAEDGKI